MTTQDTTQDLFDTSVSFTGMGLGENVVKGLTDAGFEHPTDIQAQLIPAILAGKDVIGQARTGTGKTAAFGLPVFHMADPDIQMQGLVLTPTRELATQVAAEMDALGKHTPIRTSCIIGGESMRAQQKSVERGGHILVGTPGRVMDLHGRRQINFDRIKWVILDEVDRMLDIGFREDIKKILRSVRGEHQTIFVSATIDRAIESLARSFMKKDAEKITTVSGSLTVSMVDQKYLPVEPWDKRSLLLHMIRQEKPETTVVFCKTKATVHKITKYLQQKDISAREIHGDLQQRKRTQVMDAMRNGELDVLIASDLAARGLDVEHITHVINYDLPDDPEVYVHRIGRTARAGRRGIAWSFVTPDQGQLLTEIEKIAGAMIEKLDYPKFKPGPVPDDIRDDRAAERRRAEAPARTLESRVAGAIDTSGYSEDELKAMFPDGNIPKNLPKRGLGGKFRTRR
jgi:ATP-dependent RNA helicase DeaD